MGLAIPFLPPATPEDGLPPAPDRTPLREKGTNNNGGL
jgi:hypothetical protein